MKSQEWKTYRTRFLVKSKQLTSNLTFVDHLGRQHTGRKGDYLVESFDGVLSIAPRRIFEDIYVPMPHLDEPETPAKKAPLSAPAADHRKVEAIEIQELKLPERKLSSSPVPSRTDVGRSNVARIDTSSIVVPDQSGRGGRKLPQSCRIRPSSSGFSIRRVELGP